MFGRKQIDMNQIIPTSKMTLKLSCIKACDNDLTKATELYEFLSKDMENLPDFDVQPPSTFQQIKGIANDLFGWVDQNQDKLIGAYNFFRSMKDGTPVGVPTGIPPTGVPPIPQ